MPFGMTNIFAGRRSKTARNRLHATDCAQSTARDRMRLPGQGRKIIQRTLKRKTKNLEKNFSNLEVLALKVPFGITTPE
jgi:hypothetical protein